jgi:peptidoglycan/LPS O-acetylase OafA/YrhL
LYVVRNGEVMANCSTGGELKAMVLPSRETIPALTGLRFVAALGVLLYHYQLYGVLVVPAILVPLLTFGRNGVGLFFILSGYVITYNYLDQFRDGLGRRGVFLWARIARITPMHLICLLIMTPISLLLVNSDPQAPSSIIVASWLLNVLHLQAWLPAPVFNRWDLPSWSISAEMSFYWLFPAFAYGVLNRCRSARRLSLLLPCLYLAGATVLGFLVLTIPGHLDGAYYSPIVRVWEFLTGCVLGTLRLQAPPSGSRRRDLLLGLVFVGAIAGAFLLPSEVWLSIGWYVVGLPVFATLVALLGAGRSRIGDLLASRWLTRLGEGSYSLYLLHWIPMTLAIYAMAHGVFNPGPASVGLVGLVIIASLATYRWVESPCRKWLRAHQPTWTTKGYISEAPVA